MPIKSYVVTLDGNAQQLSAAVSLAATDPTSFTELHIQAGGAAAVYVHNANTVSSTVYGMRADASSVPVVISGAQGGPIRLSEVWVRGTATQTVHILGVYY